MCRGEFVKAAGSVALFAMLFVSTPDTLRGQDGTQQRSRSEASVALRNALFAELASDAEQFERQLGLIKRVVKLVTPNVVHIDSWRSAAYGDQPAVEESGSGIIVDIEDVAYVLTNRHVVADVPLKSIKIRTADDRFLNPTQVRTDPNTDVAILWVEEGDLLAARLGDSSDVDIGDFVLAVGSPFGLSHSVSYGIISAKGRWDLQLGSGRNVQLQNFLQTDAAINPGNSGGPLLNVRGEVIGINTAIASNSGGNDGIGFSIPINLAMNVARQLVERGVVSTAYLGVVLDSRFAPGMAERYGLDRPGGALVKAITPGSPASQAQLKAGDIIVEFNGVHIQDDSHLVNLVSLTPLDRMASLKSLEKRSFPNPECPCWQSTGV